MFNALARALLPPKNSIALCVNMHRIIGPPKTMSIGSATTIGPGAESPHNLGMPIYRDLPARVLEAMEHRGWSQAKLAKEAGLSQPTVSELVRGITGEVKLETVAKLARALRGEYREYA